MPREWHGTLVEDKADEAGTLYRRERYYEPTTGRFTQEDPIGLAGGLNLYGFANGDPVNFADPFGLCPNCRNELSSRYNDEEQKFQAALTPRDRLALSAMVVGAAAAGAGGFALVARLAGPAIPVLASGRGHDMLRQAVSELQGMASSQRVGAFRDFARQIEAATQGRGLPLNSRR